METTRKVRYRAEVSTSVKGVRTWSGTVELEVEASAFGLDADALMEEHLHLLDAFVDQMDRRFPPPTPE